MTLKAAVFYSAECDYPGCARMYGEDDDYQWMRRGDIVDQLSDHYSWLSVYDMDKLATKHYCEDHVVADNSEGGRRPMDPLNVDDQMRKVFDQLEHRFSVLQWRINNSGQMDRWLLADPAGYDKAMTTALGLDIKKIGYKFPISEELLVNDALLAKTKFIWPPVVEPKKLVFGDVF